MSTAIHGGETFDGVDPESILSDLRGRHEDTGPRSVRNRVREVQYWRKCVRENCNRHVSDKGYITIGPKISPHTAMEWSDFRDNKHAEPLDEKYGTGLDGEMFSGPTRFYNLIRNGGLKEMPIRQMLDYGWHRMPSIIVAIPELEQYQDQDLYCEYGCPKVGSDIRVFLQESHRADHYRVMHQEVVGPKAVGHEMGEVVKFLQTGDQRRSDEDIAKIISMALIAFEQSKTKTEAKA